MSTIWSRLVNLTSNITGILPLANGGTNAAIAATQGGLIYSTSSALAVNTAGTTSDWALSGGTGTPTFSSTTTTAKFVDGSADAVQMRVQGHSTQTSDILAVEKSDTTLLFEVTNTGGTLIRGDTVGTAPATGFVGEIVTNSVSNTNQTTGQYADRGTLTSLPIGTWDISGAGGIVPGATTSIGRFDVGIGTASGNSSTGLVTLQNAITNFFPTGYVPTDEIGFCTPVYRVTISTATTYYLKTFIVFGVTATCGTKGYIRATRVK